MQLSAESELKIFGGTSVANEEEIAKVQTRRKTNAVQAPLPTWDLKSKEPKSCEIHGLPLQIGLADIAYGLLRVDKTYWADMKDLFPNSRSWVGGGCVSMGVDVTQADCCPLCREAEGLTMLVRCPR